MATEGQRVVLITGCSSGIGLAIAVMLARDQMKRYYGKIPQYSYYRYLNNELCDFKLLKIAFSEGT